MKILQSGILLSCLIGLACTQSSRADGTETYVNSCAKCHGAEGKGDTKMGQKLGARDFSDATVQKTFSDAEATKAIKEGLKKDEKTLMKPFDSLSDADIAAVVKYVRSLQK